MKIHDIEITSFLNLTIDQQLMVLSWRNNDDVRFWMYNSHIISKTQHFDFIDILKTNQSKKYFLLSKDDVYIGVIYFVNINILSKSSEFGLYANPNLNGMGEILLDVICEYAFNELKLDRLLAEVFSNNTKAINLYKKFSFRTMCEKYLGEKCVLIMELKNENRKL